MNVKPATKRTFYIERRGEKYRVVQVWEKGATFGQKEMQDAFARVLNSNPDERIIAEQSVSIAVRNGLVAIEGDQAAEAIQAAKQIVADRPAPFNAPNPVYADIADHDEDARIEIIGKTCLAQQKAVAFLVDCGQGYEGKGDRYIKKLQEQFPGIRVVERGAGPAENVEYIKIAPPLN